MSDQDESRTFDLGRTRMVFVPSIADAAAPKLATEIDAAGSLDLSEYLYGAEFCVSDPAPMTPANKADALDGLTSTFPDLQYVYDPSSPDDEHAAVWAKMLEPTTTRMYVDGEVVALISDTRQDPDDPYAYTSDCTPVPRLWWHDGGDNA